MNVPEIIVEIKMAFQDVNLDGGIGIRQAKVIDNYGRGVTAKESAALIQQDRRDNWMELTAETLNNYCIIPHLDAKGFRFYIPAYILSVLNFYDPYSERVSSTLSALYPTKDDFWNYHMQQYSLLTAQQCTTIAHFLQALPHFVILDKADRKIVERAMHNYWHQYL